METMDSILSIFAIIFFFIFFLLEAFLPFLIPIFFISFIRKNISNSNFKNNNIILGNNKNKYNDVSNSKLADLNISDINKLKDYLYSMFYDFEVAYNNLDYNKMKKLCSSKVYNNYHTNICLNLKFGNKKIIDNIEKRKVTVFDVYSSNYKQVISTTMEISYLNYMTDGNGNIVSGSNINKITETFEVIFVKRTDAKDVIKCPNCGASVSGNTCSYCGMDLRNTDFVIDSIKRIVV